MLSATYYISKNLRKRCRSKPQLKEVDRTSLVANDHLQSINVHMPQITRQTNLLRSNHDLKAAEIADEKATSIIHGTPDCNVYLTFCCFILGETVSTYYSVRLFQEPMTEQNACGAIICLLISVQSLIFDCCFFNSLRGSRWMNCYSVQQARELNTIALDLGIASKDAKDTPGLLEQIPTVLDEIHHEAAIEAKRFARRTIINRVAFKDQKTDDNIGNLIESYAEESKKLKYFSKTLLGEIQHPLFKSLANNELIGLIHHYARDNDMDSKHHSSNNNKIIKPKNMKMSRDG